jgi:hypothetical protein
MDGKCGKPRQGRRNRLPACDSVGFPLFGDLAHDASGLIERMLGPIVFADWAWCRRPFRGGLLLGLRDGGHVLPLLLDKEKAAQDQRD